ncbi:ATP-dependent protease La [Desulfobulbus propionicus DSM 2032]|uniref:Lon protease n=1 Tax=Desulfobulbus propionicus (strain ATCC 33891 / DSM 2032 / VKM B-1956 / 1pr3) TaxID=577650 RepID=A0A7U3YKT1_DESPD|nr:endopeptidase La [Desulfobulbus propionicus]ADW17219.1 ATP-dependent protease La [Desulfobulbus propionicus DSM 2032]
MEQEQQTPPKKLDPSQLELPETLPILPLHGFVFYPGMGFPLQVSSETSKQLIDDILLGDRMMGLVPSRREQTRDEDVLGPDDLYQVGVVGYLHKLNKAPEGYYQILVSGTKKFAISAFVDSQPYMRAKVVEVPMEIVENKQIEALLFNIRTQFQKLVGATELPQELVATINSLANPFYVAYLVSSQLNLKIEMEQEILEITPLHDLLHRVAMELAKRLETVEMSNQLQASMKKDMDERQREFFLRQQLQAIRKELGEGDDDKVEVKELKEKVAEKGLSPQARAVVDKELVRLERIPPSSPEYTVSRNYIDWILDLPWLDSTTDTLDLLKAEADLNQDHYGLKKIKKRILEFLAVRKLKEDIHGPILCFVGPPGVGKTSLGQSIARTMNRKFVRIALGGVRDEAEIRGHRRTYIGALPGRIIESLKRAGSNNPVFLLDEIDKLGNDFRGDPSSALLEVLDPEQNATFTDHYLDIEFDLSKVMFIATANVLDTIPGPLRDRMEVVELSGYTQQEKVAIASRHLLPKQLEAHALTEDDLEIPEAAIETLIASYTREAGVRNLEREIAAICRGTAAEIARGRSEKMLVTPEKLYDFLGPQRFYPEMKARSWGPGLATGLAWTPVGGQILFIETSKMKGRGGLTLTGKLGEVMKESATAALTYIRSHAQDLGVDEEIFATIDLHVHVPEGAIPKDGPSAGVAMVSSLVSVILGRPVRQDVAMTGEITLRGDVLPVGGIGEKVLAALRAGIRELILPVLNEKDVLEIPEDIRQGVVFHYPHTIREVLEIAMEKTEAQR